MNRATTYSLLLLNEIENMKLKYSSVLIKLSTLLYLLLVCISLDFDYFYFVQQWPGSHYCGIRHPCCYPPTGKPAANFLAFMGYGRIESTVAVQPIVIVAASLNHLRYQTSLKAWRLTKWPSLTCPSNNGETFWSHEWKKHGTCSESVIDQYKYFKVALELKIKVDFLQILKTEGILPDGEFYSPELIKEAIGSEIGYTPGIRCNADAAGNLQLFQIYMCVDTSGSKIIECPRFPSSRCGRKIKFPSF